MNEKNSIRAEWSISFKQLGLLVLVFILGLITALLFLNTKTDVQTTFSTTQLIGFVLSVVLSGASIVLAVSAIALGRSSEQAVIKRSDESIRLQNDVFIKTTEALQRIEASTGVTEKRIEDIISGRVGDISQTIAELATGKRKGKIFDQNELENEIRRSLLQGVREDLNPEKQEEARKKRLEKKEKYEKFHQLVLSTFSNRQDTKAQKLGHGHTSGEGDDLFDGIFKIGENKVGLSAFDEDVSDNISSINSYIDQIAKNIISKNIQHAVLVFDADPCDQDGLAKNISEQLQLYKDNPIEYLSIIAARPEEVEEKLSELTISNNQMQPTS